MWGSYELLESRNVSLIHGCLSFYRRFLKEGALQATEFGDLLIECIEVRQSAV